ncbi:MAG: undecaprenyl-diphosphate phosphatase [Bryobacteraceae bacterium]
MNTYLLAVLLGIIEGLTEFLPVSSTAHLRIAEALLGLDLSNGYWKMFTVVIQLGAVLCLPLYFRARIAAFLATFPNGRRGDRNVLTHPLTLTFIAFVCTAVPAFLLAKVIGKHLESIPLMAVALIVGGVVMWGVDAVFGVRNRSGDVEDVSIRQAVWIGLCQTLSAVFPGTSRSMATIAAGESAGLSRSTALEFSFLLSIPTMAAATLYDLFKSIKHPDPSSVGSFHLTSEGIVVLAIGCVVSFAVAWVVVAWFMNWVKQRGFAPFAIYRIVLGIAVLIWMRG